MKWTGKNIAMIERYWRQGGGASEEALLPYELLETYNPDDANGNFDYAFLTVLLQHSDGTILSFFRKTSGHIADINDCEVHLRTGTEVWSNPTVSSAVVVPDAGNTINDYSAGITSSDRIFIVYHHGTGFGDNNAELRLKYSDNKGVSWSTPVNIKPVAVSGKRVNPFGTMKQLSDGSMAFTMYSYEIGQVNDYRIYFCKCDDPVNAPETWTFYKVVGPSTIFYSEASFQEFETGMLHLVCRGEQPDLWYRFFHYNLGESDDWTTDSLPYTLGWAPSGSGRHHNRRLKKIDTTYQGGGGECVVEYGFNRETEEARIYYAPARNIKRLGIYAYVEATGTVLDSANHEEGYNDILFFRNKYNGLMVISDGSTTSANLEYSQISSEHIPTVNALMNFNINFIGEDVASVLGNYPAALTANEEDAITTFVNSMRAAGIWYHIEDYMIPIAFNNSANNLIGMKGNWLASFGAMTNNGGTFGANGISFVADSSYLNTKITMQDRTLFSNRNRLIGTYIHARTLGANDTVWGVFDGTTTYTHRVGSTTARTTHGLGSSLVNSTTFAPPAAANVVQFRFDNSYKLLHDNTQQHSATNAQTGEVAIPIFLGARNNQGTPDTGLTCTIKSLYTGVASGWKLSDFITIQAQLFTDLAS